MAMYRVTPLVNVQNLSANNAWGYTADSSQVKSVHAVYTASAVTGTLTLQSSLDGINWNDFIAGTAVTASGQKKWNVDPIDDLYWRVRWDNSSGSLTSLMVYVGYKNR